MVVGTAAAGLLAAVQVVGEIVPLDLAAADQVVGEIVPLDLAAAHQMEGEILLVEGETPTGQVAAGQLEGGIPDRVAAD